jgi:predicted amidohydrolase YtcJ
LLCAAAAGSRWALGTPPLPRVAGRAATLGQYDEPVGRIAQGCAANFVILDRDIFTIDVNDIHKTAVEQTWMRGEKVYERR